MKLNYLKNYIGLFAFLIAFIVIVPANAWQSNGKVYTYLSYPNIVGTQLSLCNENKRGKDMSSNPRRKIDQDFKTNLRKSSPPY